MEILINNGKTIREIQEEFQKSFPFLKIEFYKEYHLNGKGSPKNIKWSPGLTIREIRKLNNEGHLTIHESMKVSEVESEFSKVFGLPVQIFRKSGRIWLQTTRTDDWTIAKQNQKAQQNVDNEVEIIDAKDRMDME